MKTEKMTSQKAIDFLFDQTGKLRTTRVRHQAIVDALGIVKTELRNIAIRSTNECRIAENYFQKAKLLLDEIKGLKAKLKHEEDRAAGFAHRIIELENEIERKNKKYKKTNFFNEFIL